MSNDKEEARFAVQSFVYKFDLFDSKPIYMIFDVGDNEQIGQPFNSFKKARDVCKWMNEAMDELIDYRRSAEKKGSSDFD